MRIVRNRESTLTFTPLLERGVKWNFEALLGDAFLSAYGKQPNKPDAQPLLVALEAPLTGDQRANGRDMWRGAKLAAEAINRRGGVLGKSVRLIPADDKADPARALPLARELNDRGVDAVIGPYNSSVGVLNLPYYVDQEILPVHLTSTDDTSGLGVTVQPKNSQIAPVEEAYILGQKVQRVAMLVDPSAYTVGMADRLEAALEAEGLVVERFEVIPGSADYSAVVAEALATDPDLVYASTYYPEGSQLARQLVATGTEAQLFMGLANVDAAFVREAGLAVAQACVFSGVPEAAQIPTARRYTRQYRRRFDREPGVWGTFTYDSLQLAAEAMERAGSTAYEPALDALLSTRGYRGQTGTINIDAITGNRIDAPVFILEVNEQGEFVVFNQ